MTPADLDALFLGAEPDCDCTEPDCDCGDGCQCPGRVPVRVAMERAAGRLLDIDPDLFWLCEQGDACIHMCADGETGWAWWVTIDKDAIHPDAGEEVLGTEYVYPRDVTP